MELVLSRAYFPEGTNGRLECEGRLICKTIELPWRNNRRAVSCIPEGKYLLKKRYSLKFKWHVEITGVENRSLILIHPANHALKELNGCIAPVSSITGAGQGSQSRDAFNAVRTLVYDALDKNQKVSIIIKS
ncbi:MAG: hypothetical protein EOO51_08465 [Flavobacterium sp.]|nr:MAG: hypothetical protein EOO51_08465 [Flavobacterium sp.]